MGHQSLKDAHQVPVVDQGIELVVGEARKPQPVERRVDDHRDVVAGELPADTDIQSAPVFFEFPGIDPAKGGQAQIDANVLGQVVRGLRFGMGREVTRRADDGHAEVGTDPDRDHVLLDLLAQPDAGVITFRDQIRQFLIDRQFDADFGIVPHQLLDLRHQDRLRGVPACRQSDQTRRLLPQCADRADLRLDVVERRAQGFSELLSRFGRRDIAGRAYQQPHPHSLFQAPDGVAERGLRRRKPSGRAREAPLLGDNQKRDQITQFVPLHS